MTQYMKARDEARHGKAFLVCITDTLNNQNTKKSEDGRNPVLLWYNKSKIKEVLYGRIQAK